MTGGGRCRNCGVPLRFVQMTTTNRVMPVDPTPDEDGNVIARVVGGRLAGHVLTKDEEVPAGWARYMPHFSTCRFSPRRRRGTPQPRTLFDELPTETR